MSASSDQTVVHKILLYAGLVIGAILFLLPFFWMISTSLKPPDEIYVLPPKWIPSRLMWENYSKALSAAPFGRFILNTFFVAATVIIGQLIVAVPAGYAFARLRFPGKEILFMIFLSTMMIPGQVLMIPLYILIKNFGWLDSFYALIVPPLASAFNIFILRQFFTTIPFELEDAARIDGCGRIGVVLRIILPLCKPVVSTIIVFTFMWQWNNFFWPLIVISSKELHVVQIGLSYFSSAHGTEVSLLMVASLIVILPVIIVFALAQRTFIQGIALGGMKM